MTDLTPPLHGDRGSGPGGPAPVGMTIAVSRETGARGTSIAKRVAHRLGWQVYTQEHLGFLCANDAARQPVLAGLPVVTNRWIDGQLDRWRGDEYGEMPRLLLTLAARGQAVFVGRGAGFYLPREICLHARIVAPVSARVAHMADLLRLTREQAAETVRQRDERRSQFLQSLFGHKLHDLYPFDLILNSGLLTEETCTDAILAAFNGKRDVAEPESRLE